MKKLSIVLMLALVLLIGALPAANAQAADIVASGTCGANLTWTLDSDGLLTISGEGEMGDYVSGSAPWRSYVSSIKSVVINSGVTRIGVYAFRICRQLTSVTIPDSVTSIGSRAFEDCTSLVNAGPIGSGSNIEFGWTETIPANAFSFCSGLTSVTIPASVTSIGSGAFCGCTSMKSINVDNENANYYSEDGVLFNKDKTELVCCPGGKAGVYAIPASVTSIGSSAFYYCRKMTGVTIPDSVTSIGEGAFENCSLTSVKIPNGVTSIGQSTFAGCEYLSSVEIGNSVTSIGSNAFYCCSLLNRVTIPGSMTRILYGAFLGCSSLSDVYYGGTYEQWPNISIGSNNSPLKNAKIHYIDGIVAGGSCGDDLAWTLGEDGLLTIKGTGLMDCFSSNSEPWNSQRSNIYSVVIEKGVTSIGDYAFQSCNSLTSVTIPDSVTSIGSEAFSGCSSLADVYYESTFDQSLKISFDAGNANLTCVTWHCADGSFSYLAFGSCGDELTWTLDEDGLLTIRGIGAMDNYSSSYSAPWYSYRSSIYSVVIENDVTSIGDWAFCYCSNLNSATIPDSVTSIGDNAFSGCSNLTSVTIPDNVTIIGDNAFSGCSCLISVTIPDSVTSIGDNAFYYCSSLTSITIPDSVTSIGDNAFSGCSSLTSVIIPYGVTSIGYATFYSCNSLTSVTIPGSVTSISDNAFYGCRSLKEIYYGGTYEQWPNISIGSNNSPLTNAKIHYIDGIIARGICGDELTWTLDENGLLTISGNGVMDYYSSSSTVPWYSHHDSIESLVIENGVTSIGDNAFSGCSNLTGVIIPDSVTSIGDYAFQSCSNLISVTIPDSITSIGNYVFNSCSKLTSAGPIGSGCNIEFGWTDTIPANAFSGCSNLISVTIPDGVTRIGDNAFYNCYSLTSIIIPDGVTRIGDNAFYNCSSLTSITIPDSVTSIGDNAFSGCSSLTSVTIPYGVTSIGYATFYSCNSLTSVTIPGSVTSISDNAFYGCRSLKEIYYGGTYEQWPNISIGSNNSPLTNAKIHYIDGIIARGICGDELTWTLDENGLLTISGNGVMDYYSSSSTVPWYSHHDSIESLVIENGVTSIGDNAFSGCSSLTGVIIPDSVTSIGQYAFCYCSSLTSVTIPDNVTSIGYNAFSGCSNLIIVTIPDSITSIGNYVFNSCSKLTSAGPIGSGCNIEFGWTDTIPANAFSGCSNLISVTIPDGVTRIEEEAFESCSSLANVIIPDGVTRIGNSIFTGCSSLASVTIPDSVTRIGRNAFYNCYNLTSAGPIGSGSDIEFGWTDTIPANAFSYCSNLASVTIPASVTSIGEEAFYNCSRLTSVTIPDNVTSIGDRAFYNCSSLVSVTIPDSVTSIGYRAFYTCSNLTSVTITDWLFRSDSYASDIFYYCPNLTVYGYSGTWLEGWLANSGINFSPLGAAPNWIDGTYLQPEITGSIIHITSADDLAWLAQYVNSGHALSAFTVVLDEDLDLDGKLWTPIGMGSASFGGVFDGQGHTISGMIISIWDGNGGLFGQVSGSGSGVCKICNLCLADAKITCRGTVYPIANAANSSIIVNCGVWGWASSDPYLRSGLAWCSFQTPNGDYSRVNGSAVTEDYLRSVEFLDWINSYIGDDTYDWVAATGGSDNGFPRLATQISIRTWEAAAETVTPQDDVYDIYTPQQLGYIGKLVNGGNTLNGKTVRLQADLDLSAYYWVPMSNLSADFDGNGHTITGIKVGSAVSPCKDYAGLIGTMNGNVTSLTIEGEINATNYAGMIAAFANGNITDCYVNGSISGSGYVGGLVGYSYGAVKTSHVNGKVEGASTSVCGGITGSSRYNSIEQCSFAGSVVGSCVGGISGESVGIYKCYAEGTLTGNTVGGISGNGIGAIHNCYSNCDIIGTDGVGGIMGEYNYQTFIYYCYAAGSVSGTANVGALFGKLNLSSCTVENCYWNQDGGYFLDGLSLTPRACGNSDVPSSVTALTAEQMRQQSSFVGFDFNTVWAIDSSTNDGMPYLRQDEPEYMPGDINGDGVLNNKDVTRLMRYIKYHDVDVEEAALDVNGDGVVNNKDVTRLMRYIKYGDVEIF